MQRTNKPMSRCTTCAKSKHATAGECKRAARRLAHNKRNDHRYFNVRRCRFCEGHPYIIYSTSLDNRKSKRRRKMDRELKSVEQEERETVISCIIDDARMYRIDPLANYIWLEKAYGEKIARDIIDAAYQSLKEIKQ
jgi:hypothetical protein